MILLKAKAKAFGMSMLFRIAIMFYGKCHETFGYICDWIRHYSMGRVRALVTVGIPSASARISTL